MPVLGGQRGARAWAHLDGLPRQEQRLLPLCQLQVDSGVPRGGLGTAMAALCHPERRKETPAQSPSPGAARLAAHGAARAAGLTHPQTPRSAPAAQGSPSSAGTPRALSPERPPGATCHQRAGPAALTRQPGEPPGQSLLPRCSSPSSSLEKTQQLGHDLPKLCCPPTPGIALPAVSAVGRLIIWVPQDEEGLGMPPARNQGVMVWGVESGSP